MALLIINKFKKKSPRVLRLSLYNLSNFHQNQVRNRLFYLFTKEIVTDGQIIFSRAAAAVYMGPYAKAALTKVPFSRKLQNLKI